VPTGLYQRPKPWRVNNSQTTVLSSSHALVTDRPYLVTHTHICRVQSGSVCQTPSKTQTDGCTDRRLESNLVHFSLENVTSGGTNFNDFPDNQLIKFRVFIGWSRIFTPPPIKFLWSIAFSPPVGRTRRPWQTQRTKGRQSVSRSVRPSFRSSLRWSLTHMPRAKWKNGDAPPHRRPYPFGSATVTIMVCQDQPRAEVTVSRPDAQR